jgi:lysophospholipase L1-like esterase
VSGLLFSIDNGKVEGKMLKNIMCFGDSNTHGFIAASGERYDENTRWTRLLQRHLGIEYYVIEEGLNGRTTVYDDTEIKNTNGKLYLEVCIATHKPLDLVIIMLGTNDTKERFNASPKDIANGMEQLIKILRDPNIYNNEILIISPIHISDKILDSPYCESFGGLAGAEKSRKLAAEYKELAKKYNCHFMDAANYAKADDKDAIHLDKEGHRALAQAVYQKIKEIEKIL